MKISSKVLSLAFGISIAAWAQQPASPDFQVASSEATPAAADPLAQPADTTQMVQQAPDTAVTAAPAEVAVTDSVPANSAPVDSQAVATDSAAVDTTANVAAAPADTTKRDTVAAVPDTTARDTVQPVAEQPKVDSAAFVPATVAVAPADTAKPVETVPEIESPLDKILHGNAYNLVGNEAAAATVAGEMAIPHHMVNRNFAYFEPVDEEGVVSFGKGTTFFFAFNNSDDLALVSAGLARESFGILLQGAVGKQWRYVDDDKTGSEETVKGTSAGTALGGTVSAKLAGLDFAIRGVYHHPESDGSIHSGEVEKESENWNLGGAFSVSKAGKKVSWTAAVGVQRYNSKYTTTEKSIIEREGKRFLATSTTHMTDSTARVEVVPEFNIGWAILRHEKGRVFIGLNTMAPLATYDRIVDVCSRHNEYALVTTPNILGEVMLGKYVVAFGSASHQWDLVRYRDSYIRDVSTKTVDISSGFTTANIGFRLEYELAALELAFTKQFLSNPFGSFSTTEEMATSIGMFINF